MRPWSPVQLDFTLVLADDIGFGIAAAYDDLGWKPRVVVSKNWGFANQSRRTILGVLRKDERRVSRKVRTTHLSGYGGPSRCAS